MHPILFSIGPITIYTFGLFLAIAFLVGTFVIWRYGRDEINEEIILDLVLIITITSLISGRLVYILLNPHIFEGNILRMIHFFNFPGFSFLWGMFFGLISGILFSFKKKLNIGLVMDILSLGLALGISIGNFGCLFNGCIVGVKTNLPWGINTIGVLGKRQPISLYEALIMLVIYIIIRKLYLSEKNIRKYATKKDKKNIEGKIASIFFILFGLSYFLLEFFRESSVYLLGLKGNQPLYIIMVIIGIGFLIKLEGIQKIKDIKHSIFNKESTTLVKQ